MIRVGVIGFGYWGPNYARVLSDLGFTRIKVLRINDNFAHDWVAKGYPTRKGGT